MRKLFEDYGAVVVIIIAVVALITMVTVLTNENGGLNTAFKTVIQEFSDKANDMIEGSAGGSGSNEGGGSGETGGSGESGETDPTKLAAPEISISGTILTIGAVENATSYEVYNGDTLLTTTSRDTVDLAVWITAVGDYNIGVKAIADGYTASEMKTIVYSIATEITYTDFSVTSSNRAKVGYTGEENENLVIPATFYDEEDGRWYKVTRIGTSAFYSCTNLTSIEIPTSVTSIGEFAFDGCTSLTSATIPASVTRVGQLAFSSCVNLKNIVYEGTLEQWLNISFNANCANPCCYGAALYINTYELVDDVVIPANVTTIGAAAFEGCTSLTSVIIPDSVTSIGDKAFYGCTKLGSVTFGENSELTSIGQLAFKGCTSLSSITIPEGVPTIGEKTFDGCTSLTSVTFADYSQLTSIGGYAFNDCTNLESVIFGENSQLTTIGALAFNDCTSLTSVTIPDNVTEIGERAFQRCVKISTIVFEGTSVEWAAISFGESWDIGVSATSVYCKGDDTNVDLG